MDEETSTEVEVEDVEHEGTGPAEQDFDENQLPPDDFDSFATEGVIKEEE